jgi:hypothetical protein
LADYTDAISIGALGVSIIAILLAFYWNNQTRHQIRVDKLETEIKFFRSRLTRLVDCIPTIETTGHCGNFDFDLGNLAGKVHSMREENLDIDLLREASALTKHLQEISRIFYATDEELKKVPLPYGVDDRKVLRAEKLQKDKSLLALIRRAHSESTDWLTKNT